MNMVMKAFVGELAFLSNFWPCEVEFEGKLYPSSEHAFQAAKTIDDAQREKIRAANMPVFAKRIGRNPKLTTMRPDWDSVKNSAMLEILRFKFSDPTLAQMLVDTGDTELVEENWWGDVYWGVCKGKGENHLGRILMQIRDELKKGTDNVSN